MNGVYKEIRTHWVGKDSDERSCYMAVDGTVSLADLIKRMAEVAPHASHESIMLNWATVRWERPSTPEERAERAEGWRRHDERREAWERETYERLKAKFEPAALPEVTHG